MATTATYTGFNTIGATSTRNVTLYDVALVRRDLLNHFMTRIGERVMRPDFGCRIWDYLMDQGPDIENMIIEEAKRVCAADPRVSARNFTIYYFEKGVRVDILLDYIGIAVAQTFSVSFEMEERLAYGQTA